MTEDEVAQVLRRTGHPMWVAMQYQPPRTWLVRQLPQIVRFLFFVIFLRIVLPLFLIHGLSEAIGSEQPWRQMLAAVGGFLVTTLANLGAVALLLVILDVLIQKRGERWPALLGKDSPWNPRNLPELREEHAAISRTASLFGLFYASVFTLWWTEVLFPHLWGWSAQAGLFQIRWLFWMNFHSQWYMPIFILGLVWMALSALLLVRPHWGRLKLAFRVLGSGSLALMLILSLRSHGMVLQHAGSKLQALAEGSGLPEKANLVIESRMQPVLVMVVVLCLVVCVVNVFRLFRRSSPV